MNLETRLGEAKRVVKRVGSDSARQRRRSTCGRLHTVPYGTTGTGTGTMVIMNGSARSKGLMSEMTIYAPIKNIHDK